MGASSLLGWDISADASSSRSSSVTSFRGSEISDAVSELGVELDEVLDESHELLVHPSTARSLERTTQHLSSSSAWPVSLVPSGSTPSELMGLTRRFLFACEAS